MVGVLDLVEGESVIFVCYSSYFICDVCDRVVQDNPRMDPVGTSVDSVDNMIEVALLLCCSIRLPSIVRCSDE